MTAERPRRRRGAWRLHVLGLAILITALCEVMLLYDVLADTFYLDVATPWIDRGSIELMVVVALGFALLAIGKGYRDVLLENRAYETTVRMASGQLFEVIRTKFSDWGLTESEREIALMLIKGYSVQEIGELRNRRPGTVKSQSNAVYRKAGVSGRNELVAYFVEDLLAGDDLVAAAENGPEMAENGAEARTRP